ncbi:hypothetical protein BaRGS_00012807 [Batillaria attramentaria]|uniref:Uncharacterized protein n=1 Tax=Batillaria attramentaria TaxID=370345 RepID=A0ABD0L973_9CAEN
MGHGLVGHVVFWELYSDPDRSIGEVSSAGPASVFPACLTGDSAVGWKGQHGGLATCSSEIAADYTTT